MGECGTWFSLLELTRAFLFVGGVWGAGVELVVASAPSRLRAAIRFWEGEGTGELLVEEGVEEEEEDDESAVP